MSENLPKNKPTLVNIKSGWKANIREFLMLFLAVFCGFLAENYREERQEREVAMVTLESILLDLHRDSIQLEDNFLRVRINRKRCDSLEAELLGSRIENNSGPALRLLSKVFGFADFNPNDASIQQLNTNGSLRVVREREILDALTLYQTDKAILKVNEGNMNPNINEMQKLRQHFDLLRFAKEGNHKPIPLLANDKDSRNRFYERINSWNKWFTWLENDQIRVLESGNMLRKAIRQHYPTLKAQPK